MSIQLVTYANQTVTPTNDAIIYERAIDQNGIFYGCNVTVSGNEVHITGGYGIVCGREFTIQSEAITVTLAPSGTLDGRLYVRLDLADADNPIQLLTATGNTLPPLEQDDDVNYTNGTYEMELATFTVGVSALSDVVETFETIGGTKPYVDYIIEEKTSGNWFYRKWNSGRGECWYRANLGQITLGTQLGTDIVSDMFRLNFPFTFTATPTCLFNYEGNSTGYCWVQYSSGYDTSTTQSYGIRLARVGTSSFVLQNNYVNCYACGKWK